MQFDSLTIDPVAYGIQGSAVLGIKDSGKTYTATLLAEYLFEAEIPFIAFDPIGVWRYLRVPGAGRGFPIVVAGGYDPDIQLTPETAPVIVESAMEAGVSLVIDLFHVDLSKADWRRIVKDCVRLLLHKNKGHGLRHVFIEEASEFIPQKINDGQVYAEVEKLARMGGNVGLGYTLINQRAEEVNKAVLELCDNLFLHRQKGKNSLASLRKWLDLADVKDAKALTDTLSTLPQGTCWAWLEGSKDPIWCRVPQKQSFHPDRRVLRGAGTTSALKVDASEFIAKIKAMPAAVPVEEYVPAGKPDKTDWGMLIRQAENTGYDRGHADGSDKIMHAVAGLAGDLANSIGRAEEACAAAKRLLASFSGFVGSQADEITSRPPYIEPFAFESDGGPAIKTEPLQKPSPGQPMPSGTSLNKPQQRMVDALAWWESFGIKAPTVVQAAYIAGYAPGTGTWNTYRARATEAGLITAPMPGHMALTPRGRTAARKDNEPKSLVTLHNKVKSQLPMPQTKMLEKLIDVYPKSISDVEWAKYCGYAPGTGTWNTYKARLKRLGISHYPKPGHAMAADWLFPESF